MMIRLMQARRKKNEMARENELLMVVLVCGADVTGVFTRFFFSDLKPIDLWLPFPTRALQK